MTLYEVVKFNQEGRQTIIKSGLSLGEAQRICSDPESSSMTARNSCDGNEKKIANWHDKQSHWFYGFRRYEG